MSKQQLDVDLVGSTLAAQILGVSVPTIYNWERRGKLRRAPGAPRHTYRVADLLAFRAYVAALPPDHRGRPRKELSALMEAITA